jgi:hypothetical protein
MCDPTTHISLPLPIPPVLVSHHGVGLGLSHGHRELLQIPELLGNLGVRWQHNLVCHASFWQKIYTTVTATVALPSPTLPFPRRNLIFRKISKNSQELFAFLSAKSFWRLLL